MMGQSPSLFVEYAHIFWDDAHFSTPAAAGLQLHLEPRQQRHQGRPSRAVLSEPWAASEALSALYSRPVAGRDPATHVVKAAAAPKTWMRGSSPRKGNFLVSMLVRN